MTDTTAIYSHPNGLADRGHALLEGPNAPHLSGFIGISRRHERQKYALIATPEEVSEYDGAALSRDLVNELFTLRGRPQEEAFLAFHAKLKALNKLDNVVNATSGFAGQLVNVLDFGIANLPMLELEPEE